MAINGSCHCGAVAFTMEDEPTQAVECNCSICRRKGHLLAFSPVEKFTLHTPREALGAYTFGKHNIRHQFCSTCGCGTFGEGKGPDGKPMVAVNMRCAENFDLATLTIIQFDGAHKL